jgi:hypothetical protein
MNCHNFDPKNINKITKKFNSDLSLVEDYFIELFESSSENTYSVILDKTSHSFIIYEHKMLKFINQSVSDNFDIMLKYHVNHETELYGYILEYKTLFGEEEESLETLLRCLKRVDNYIIYYYQRKSTLTIYLLFKDIRESDKKGLTLFRNNI